MTTQEQIKLLRDIFFNTGIISLDERNDMDKAIYLIDHGWDFVMPRNQEENNAPHRYTKKNAFGLSNMLLEDAYKLEKGNNDLLNIAKRKRCLNWDDYSSVCVQDTPTHWMPLPEPPTTKEK